MCSEFKPLLYSGYLISRCLIVGNLQQSTIEMFTVLQYRNVFVFSDSFAMLAEGSEGDGLVDEQPELVLPLELDHHLQGTHLAGVHVDGLDD